MRKKRVIYGAKERYIRLLIIDSLIVTFSVFIGYYILAPFFLQYTVPVLITTSIINTWCHGVPRNLFKAITFDCGKACSNCQSVSNRNDLSIYFADPGTPSQRGLNEHSNGLLRKDGLPKDMDFNTVD